MDEVLLERYIKQYIEGQNTPEIIFSWHGGEPTLLGIEYFQKVVELQKNIVLVTARSAMTFKPMARY